MKDCIFITGCAGFIGSNLVDLLLESGFRIIGIDNFDNAYPKTYKEQNLVYASKNPNFIFYEGDIFDFELLDTCFSNNSISTIIHLAAKTGVRFSIKQPHQFFQTNLHGTLTILEMMKKYNIRNMIFASSSSVYGDSDNLLFSETDNTNFQISPYAVSKKSCELLCQTYHYLYKLNIYCLRFFSVYGPRQRPDLAIYKFTELIIKNKPILLFGDGTSKRDYTFVKDITEGIKLMLPHLKGFKIFNIGNSSAVSLIALITMLEEIIGITATIKQIDNQPGDVRYTQSNNSNVSQFFGYKPIYNLKQGLVEFVNWYNSYR